MSKHQTRDRSVIAIKSSVDSTRYAKFNLNNYYKYWTLVKIHPRKELGGIILIIELNMISSEKSECCMAIIYLPPTRTLKDIKRQ